MNSLPFPSLISVKPSDMRIVIDDTPEEYDEIETMLPSDNPVLFIDKMIEEIRQKSKKKKIDGDFCEYSTCHLCRTVLEKKFLIHCTQKSCLRYFCMRCISKRYHLNANDIYQIMQLNDWSCFVCIGACDCKICKARMESHNKPLIINPAQNGLVEGMTISPVAGTRPTTKLVNKLNKYVRRKSKKVQDSDTDEEDDVDFDDENDKKKKKSLLNQPKARKPKGECHGCVKKLPNIQLATCMHKYCRTQFCVPCIQKDYQKGFTLEEYNYRTWACFGCKGGCKCSECAEIRQQGRTEKIKKYSRSKESKKSGSIKASSRQHKLQDSSFSPPTTKVMVLDGQQAVIKTEDIAMPDPEDDDITLDKKNIDDSKIISEINIDSACITLYDFETVDQLKEDIQKKFDNESEYK